jgi:hypothetical protein
MGTPGGRRNRATKTIARVLLAAVLASGSGCTRSDWIERTLVTVDVTGTWEGSAPTALGQSWLRLILEQQGARVTGSVQARGAPGRGNINGTVTGDVFTFRHTEEPRFTGEMTVSGDEMTGQASIPYSYNQARLTLRRVTSSPPR